jgi:predicted esterase
MGILLPAFFIGCLVYGQTHTARIIPIPGFGNLGFYEFRPANYGSQLHPCIIFLHGAGQVPDKDSGITYHQLAKILQAGIPMLINNGATMQFGSNSFVVLSPQTDNDFDAGGGGEYWRVPTMLKYAKDSLHIDTNRIYITGLSMGGGGTWEAISFDPSVAGQFAAAAPISGYDPYPDTSFCTTARLNIPIWAFHNDQDPTVPAWNGTKAVLGKITSCTNPAIDTVPRVTYYASSQHDAWDDAYDMGHHTYTLSTDPNFVSNANQTTQNVYEWFLQHSRAPAPAGQPPVVSAGSNQTITLPTSSVTLSGTDSASSGHTITATAWVKASGPSGSTITSPSSPSTTVTGLVQGSYIFQFSATDDHGLSSNAQVTITVNPAAVAPGALGYLVSVGGPIGNCGNTDTSGRFAVYGSSLANGAILYSDSARTTPYNGGWGWFEFAAAINGPILHDLDIHPDGSINSLSSCPGVSNGSSGPAPLGYIVTSGGPGANCGDTTAAGRTAIYGDSLANGVILSPDPDKADPLDGGYAWVGFSATLHGPVTQSFAVYADGSLHSLQSCGAGQQAGRGTLSGSAATLGDRADKDLIVYPNPVTDQAIIHIPGTTGGRIVIRLNSSGGGMILSKIAYKGNGPIDLTIPMSGLSAGMYIVEIRIGDGIVLRKKILKQ